MLSGVGGCELKIEYVKQGGEFYDERRQKNFNLSCVQVSKCCINAVDGPTEEELKKLCRMRYTKKHYFCDHATKNNS